MTAAVTDELPRPLLHDRLVEQAITTYAFSRRFELYFASVQLVVRDGDTVTPVGASSLALGEPLARAKCRSELLEHWSNTAWERSGSPPLEWAHLWSGGAVGPPPAPANPTRRDATGLCAGPTQSRSRVLLHGLLEVLERDAVTRFFDRGEGRLRRTDSGPLPEALVRVGRRWGGSFECFVAEGETLPPVAIVVYSRPGGAGAIGSACRLQPGQAVAHAASEALMMYTTARHWTRRPVVAEPFRGVVWASRHINAVLDELSSAASDALHVAAPLTEAELPRAVAERFGADPCFCTLPPGGADLAGLGVWRVAVPGSRSPATVTRQPWPVG
jgi:ribosomal protein S12 methylthiotransferase accessory factor YcaO